MAILPSAPRGRHAAHLCGQVVEDTYPLSPTQQGMLFHNLLAPQSSVYTQQQLCTFDEDLNVKAFQQAWQRVVGRHTILRTILLLEGRVGPVQVVLREVSVNLQAQDLRGLSTEEQENRLEAYSESDRHRGFDFSKGVPWRLALFRLADAKYRLVFTYHHALLDGRSRFRLFQELFEFYDAFCHGRELQLALPRPYRDYIDWLQQQDRYGAKLFWQELLQGFTTPTAVLSSQSRDRISVVQADHREQDARLSVAVTSALQALARQHGLTLNTLVQGAWALLLSRYSGEEDVVFGAARACRNWSEQGADSMLGPFINTLPVRVHVDKDKYVLPWLGELREQGMAVRPHEHTPLVEVQGWSDVPKGMSLFETIVIFENDLVNSRLRAQGGSWMNREFQLLERTNYSLSLYAYGEPELLLRISYDRQRFDDATISRMVGHLKTLLEGMVADPGRRLAALPLLTESECQQLREWNNTQVSYPKECCIHQLIEAQVERTPNAVALVCREQHLTYRQLNSRANQLAHFLRHLGVGPEILVGICLERSLDMMVGLLAILKAGGAYLPLDPAYPRDRLGFMLEDAQVPVVLSQHRLLDTLPHHGTRCICLDSEWHAIAREPEDRPVTPVQPDNLAYVLYTSGSTGKPKGVMVSHRNVVNFFTGMDERIGDGEPGTWLAVTSISFDISVLELFWTLARGFRVVLHAEAEGEANPKEKRQSASDRAMEFSLFYFASAEDQETEDKYRLLIEGAKFADQHGFSAVWTPERHFHTFGGLYPNPAVTGAAIAAVTKRVQIRAGSVVLPLHNPIRVAEEWSVVDNLSNGRVGISVASGWHDRDFVFAPENYAGRRDLMYRQVETVRRLWRGEAFCGAGGTGAPVEVKVFPRPVQRELPIWVTAARSPETFEMAGGIGANLLTHLLGQSLDELAEKIAIYRRVWREHGNGPGEGYVSLMLHTFLGEDMAAVREKVRKPFRDYLGTAVDLIQDLAKSVARIDAKDLSAEDREALLDHAFHRYFETAALLGTPESCSGMIDRLKAIGVDEVACLIDFGVDFDSVMAGLHSLNVLREVCSRPRVQNDGDFSIPSEIFRHRVSHLQCTPSLAGLLMQDSAGRTALGSLRKLMLGGEALSVSSGRQAVELVAGEVYNMYGPTETTIWSTTHRLEKGAATVPIGRPIANTETYILDRSLQPVPVGVTGELFIGGAGVVRGYLHRPVLTAERFIEHPLRHLRTEGTRLYRTGDLARYRPDGTIEFLGRLDHQVKIRGHRIELAEIEAVLCKHPAVREVAVDARDDDTSGEKRLVAYIVTEREKTPAVSELRGLLKQTLPEVMVPSVFIYMFALPRTPNGKLDRRALPAPDGVRPELPEAYAVPRNAVEEALVRIWSRVLRVERVGIHDNFFELGGDSIRSIQIVVGAKQAGLLLTARQVFQHQTIAELAAEVERNADTPLQRDAGEAATSMQIEPIALDVPLSEAELEKIAEEIDRSS